MAPIDPSSSSKPRKTRRGGAAAKRQAKNARIAPVAIPIEIDADEDEDEDENDDEVVIEPSNANASGIVMTQIIDEAGEAEADEQMDVADDNPTPNFAPLPASALSTTSKGEIRRVSIPPHRLTPLKKDWINIYSPLTEILGLQVRMNVHKRAVEIRVCTCSLIIGRSRRLLIMVCFI
jgi:RNA-binding protein PNO1